jgi:chromate transport protein ChrA
MDLSWIYALYENVGAVQALFFGPNAAVLAIVLGEVGCIGSRSLKNNVMIGLAAALRRQVSTFAFKEMVESEICSLSPRTSSIQDDRWPDLESHG